MGEVPDFNKLLKIAQKVASNIDPPKNIKNGKVTEKELSGLFGEVAKNVSKAISPDIIESLNKEITTSENIASSSKDEYYKESKVCLDDKKTKSKRVLEIESGDSSEEDLINRRTKDMHFTLSVSLDEIYNGTKKKLAFRRNKLLSDDSIQDEKKKLSVKIEPGMIDEQTIRFNHYSDEKSGYETGDVVVSLDIEEHSLFTRDGNNLLIEQEISLSDSINPVIYIKHLNGKFMKISGDKIDPFNEDDELKKVPGMGMPIMGEPGNYGDLFIKFKCVCDKTFTDEEVNLLQKIFPSKIEKPSDVEEFYECTFEMVTESDLEFLDDSEDSSEYSEESDESEESN